MDVEDFKGGRITFGGITFGDQQQQIFWNAVGRYLTSQTHEVMQRWDVETRAYPTLQRYSSLDRSAGLLQSFVGRVSGDALDTDRKLRGRGVPKTDTPKWAGRTDVAAKAEVMRVAQAHRDLLVAQPPSTEKGPTVSTASPEDFRAQAEHEASRALARIESGLEEIEARRAHEGSLISGPSLKMYTKSIVEGLEAYLQYLSDDVAAFSAAGADRASAIEGAKAALATLVEQVKANRTLTKLVGAMGGEGPHKHIASELEKFDAHAKTKMARWTLLQQTGSAQPLTANTTVGKAPNNKVFLVHGHDHGARDTVTLALKNLGLEPIILDEQASKGRTIIEKLEGHSDVGFAVVLMTPDDEGRSLKEKATTPRGKPHGRARQNVILEMGYFMARLERKHVCGLTKGRVEIPSDLSGVVVISLDEADWKNRLAKELEGAEFQIDWAGVGLVRA